MTVVGTYGVEQSMLAASWSLSEYTRRLRREHATRLKGVASASRRGLPARTTGFRYWPPVGSVHKCHRLRIAPRGEWATWALVFVPLASRLRRELTSRAVADASI